MHQFFLLVLNYYISFPDYYEGIQERLFLTETPEKSRDLEL